MVSTKYIPKALLLSTDAELPRVEVLLALVDLPSVQERMNKVIYYHYIYGIMSVLCHYNFIYFKKII